MTKRKRCQICSKLFDPRGIKKHTNWCMKRDAALSSLPKPEPAQIVDTQSPPTPDEPIRLSDLGYKLAEPDLFESIVKELKTANLGLVVVVLD